MRCTAIILAALIFSSSIAACGQKGALKLPQDTPVETRKAIPPGAEK